MQICVAFLFTDLEKFFRERERDPLEEFVLSFQTTLVHEDTFGEGEFTSTRAHLFAKNLIILMCFTFNVPKLHRSLKALILQWLLHQR